MSNEINRDLIADLARLARRYPPEDWDALVRWLEDDTRRQQLSSLLHELSIASRRTTPLGRREKRPQSIGRLFGEMQSTEPAKAELLRDLHSNLLTRELLPTAASLREFTEIAGLKSINLRKREQAANQLIRQLANLRYDEIARALEVTSSGPRDLGAEYERWVALILGRSSGEHKHDKA